MIIGSDFDGVIADDTQARIDYVKEKYGVTLDSAELHGSALEKKIGKRAKEEIEIEVNCSERTLQFTPVPGVAEVFRQLIKEGDRIVIITYRTKTGIAWARLFLEQHNIPYHHIWSAKEFKVNADRETKRMASGINMSLVKKGRLAGVVKPAVFIEDSNKHIIDMAPLKDYVKLFLFDRPHNKDFYMEGVERVYSWPEIYEKIQELKGSLVGTK